MRARVLLLAALLMTASVRAEAAPAPDDATVKRALEEEMARSMTQLKLGAEAPPYFLKYVITDGDRSYVSARLGAILSEETSPGSRSLAVEVRVGSPDQDNTNFIGASPGGFAGVSREDDYALLRRDLWQVTDREYKRVIESLARKKASRAIETEDKDKIPDFAKAPAIQVTANRATAPTDADRAKLKDLVVKLSRAFEKFGTLDGGNVSARTEVVRRRLLTSEKTWTDERWSRVHLDVRGEAVADDGQKLVSTLAFTAVDVAGLPPAEKMEAAIQDLAKNLTAQRSAKPVDAGLATVLFEGPAAGQLAKLMLATPLSGQPTPRAPGGRAMTQDGSLSFAEKLEQKVAPTWFSVVDDPTASGPGKRLLFGTYDSDDEGVKGEKVQLIERGVVKNLLMSRAPRKEITKSNGHGRGTGQAHAASSNLFINVTGGLSRPDLLAAAVRSAGPKGTVYVVRELGEASGLGRGQTLQARLAFRYKDGKEEPVRGLSLEGFVPKKLKKDLIGAGKELFVKDEEFGTPGSVVTPALLFEDVDVGKPNDKNRTPPLYPSPLATAAR
jgi:TldD protein